MDPNSYSDDDVDAYWRRRVILLAGGLVVLGLLAWALSGSGGGRPARLPVLAATGLPAAAYASTPVTGPPSALAVPALATRPATPTPGAASPTPHSRSHPRPHRRTRVAGRSGWCPDGSVVTAVVTSKPRYTSKQRPVFTVYTVSTVAGGCDIKFGAAAVRVIVTRHGKVVWNSTECSSSQVRTVHLMRGVPVQMSVTWNRHAGFGCRGWLPAGSYGRFSASARTSGGRSSTPVDFQLTR